MRPDKINGYDVFIRMNELDFIFIYSVFHSYSLCSWVLTAVEDAWFLVLGFRSWKVWPFFVFNSCQWLNVSTLFLVGADMGDSIFFTFPLLPRSSSCTSMRVWMYSRGRSSFFSLISQPCLNSWISSTDVPEMSPGYCPHPFASQGRKQLNIPSFIHQCLN
jgi:hypothetical protein